jgi:hypothetical protein
MSSKAFGSKSPLVPHLGGAVTKEIGDLRADVEEAVVSLESKAGYPTIVKVAGGAAVSVGTPVAHVVTGTDFVQDQVASSKAVPGTGTGVLTFTANRPGVPGNSLQVEVIDSAGGGLKVEVVGGNKVRVDLGGATSAVATIATLVGNTAEADALVQCVATGTGNGKLFAAAPLAGGVGLGFSVTLGGIEQTLTAAVAGTSLAMLTTGAFGAAGDSAALQVVSNGRVSNTVTVDVIA